MICNNCENIIDFPTCIGNKITTLKSYFKRIQKGAEQSPKMEEIVSCDNFKEHFDEEHPHAE